MLWDWSPEPADGSAPEPVVVRPAGSTGSGSWGYRSTLWGPPTASGRSGVDHPVVTGSEAAGMASRKL
jgi:hypothetical protein